MLKTKFSYNDSIKEKALRWSAGYSECCFLNYSQSTQLFAGHAPFPSLLAVGSKKKIVLNANENPFEKLKSFLHNDYFHFGYFSYDLKNAIENLESQNPDKLDFPDLYFFSPAHLIRFEKDYMEILSDEPEKVYQEILSQEVPEQIHISNTPITLNQNISKEQYFDKVEKIKNHLVNGDIYELNLCLEFFCEKTDLNPVETFLSLNKISNSPYSVFLKIDNRYLISASPERFLKKSGNKLISQPIKGTAQRFPTQKEDEESKSHLRNSDKEKSENMMIVDLVRNDLAASSLPGSVVVDELFGIYSFPQVHQMISTVSSTVKKEVHPVDAIRNAFPMGSMTGAPKIKAMELIDRYEESKRGLFSGAVGYFSPEGNFDFNVVIRSIFYNQDTGYLSFQTGSAITYDSNPEKEYEECLLKGKAIREVLGL